MLGSDGELAAGEVTLDEPAELLWRNLHPAWLDGGRITRQLFSPTAKDAMMLSTARSSKITAGAHYREFTEDLGLRSAGVYAVTVGEVGANGSRAIDDSAAEGRSEPTPTGHAYIDFRPPVHSRRLAAILRDLAVARGCQHASGTTTASDSPG